MIRAALVALCTLLGNAAYSADPADPRDGLTLSGVGGGSGQTAGIGTVHQASVRYHLVWGFSLELVGRSGTIFYDTSDFGRNQFYVAFVPGVSWALFSSESGWEGRLSARFTHVHHTSIDNWAKDPFGNILAQTGTDVEHRSGAELALGLTYKAASIGSWYFTLEAEAFVMHLPTSPVMEWTGGVMIGGGFRSS